MLTNQMAGYLLNKYRFYNFARMNEGQPMNACVKNWWDFQHQQGAGCREHFFQAFHLAEIEGRKVRYSQGTSLVVQQEEP